jgi:hypothetical protein
LELTLKEGKYSQAEHFQLEEAEEKDSMEEGS